MRFRFNKGDRVEVLSKGEVPSGSWRYGVITSGNGHTYYIQYEKSPVTAGAPVLERVPRKSIRPCPPVEALECWAAGDFVEIFENSSWKLGTVLNAADVNLYLVKLLGTSQKVEAHTSCLRLPRSWQDEEWVLIQKVDEVGIMDQQTTRKGYHNSHSKDSKTRFPINSKSALQMPHRISSGVLKRRSPCNTTHGTGQKLRASEKGGRIHHVVPENSMHTSSKNKDAGLLEMDMERRSPCSGGSSGTSNRTLGEDSKTRLPINNKSNLQIPQVVSSGVLKRRSPCNLANGIGQKLEAVEEGSRFHHVVPENFMHASIKNKDARLPKNGMERRSPCSGGSSGTSDKEDIMGKKHQLALDAYHRTLESLRSLGYISWEQEELITNLRLQLNISNEEHLMQLRKLVSAQ